ncbi:MAG: hypothetical protein KAH01_02215 [Caldisericia bacterium]|nr:hypothetical protein [Caldisericia bacterium]
MEIVLKWIFPSLALFLSIWSFIDSRKSNKLNHKVIEMDAILKKYDLEEREKERLASKEAKIEGSILRLSATKYVMRIVNSGRANAVNVDFILSEEAKGFVEKDKTPFEYLNPDKSYDELVFASSDTPEKFEVEFTWEDKDGNKLSKKQMLTI